MATEKLDLILQFHNRGVTNSIGALGRIDRAIKGLLTYHIANFFIKEFGRSVDAMMEFEYQMDKVAAISGASATQMANLSKNAIDIGKASRYTAQEIGSLQEVLSRRGFNSDQIILMTDSIRKLATAAGSELSQTAGVVGSVMQSFNLTGADSGRIVNTLAESFASTNLQLETFGTGIAYVGSIAPQVGISLEQIAAMMGVIANSGVKASTAGRGLRKILIEVNDSGLTLEETLGAIYHSEDQLGTATGMVGKNFANLAVTLANNWKEVATLTEKYGDANTELQNQVDIMEDNLTTDWAKLKSAINSLIVDSPKTVSGLRAITQGLTYMVQTMDRVVGKSDEELLSNLISVYEGKLIQTSISDLVHELTLLQRRKDELDKRKEQGFFPSNLSEELDRVELKLKAVTKVIDSFRDSQQKLLKGKGKGKGKDLPAPGYGITSLPPLATKNLPTKTPVAEIGALTEAVEKEAERGKLRLEASMDKLYNAIDVGEDTRWGEMMELWQILGNVLSDAIGGSLTALEDVIAGGTKGVGRALLGMFAELLKVAGRGFVSAGIANMANAAALAAASAGIATPAAIALKAKGIRQVGVGVALGASGAIAAGALRASGKKGRSAANSFSQSQATQSAPDYSEFMDAIRGEQVFRINGNDLVTIQNRAAKEQSMLSVGG